MIHIPAGGPRSLKPFFVLWTGQAFSMFGSQLVQFALIWWLTQETGSGTALAVASIVGLVPQVILGPFVGVLVDRWNRRWTMIVADALVALATLVLAVLFWTGTVEVWQVFVILFIRALGGTFHWPAMQASISLIVPQEKLTRVQGLNEMLNGGMNIIAAPVGALLVSTVSMTAVLAIDLVTAAIAISTLLLVAIPQPARAVDTTASSAIRSMKVDFTAGFRYVRGWRGLLILAGLAMMVNMLLAPSFSLMPLMVTDHFQGTAWHLGAMEAAISIGIIAGGILLGIWGGFKRRITTTLTGLIGIGLGVVIVGLAPASLFYLAVIGLLFAGVMSAFTNGPLMAIFQAVVAPEMQGRVFALMGSLTAAMMPLGLIIAGPMADIVGVQAWFVMGGIVCIVTGVASFFIRDLQTLEDGRPSAQPEAGTAATAMSETPAGSPTLERVAEPNA
jgi:DHA3 family macrolide efflux protein-like MFS transporter